MWLPYIRKNKNVEERSFYDCVNSEYAANTSINTNYFNQWSKGLFTTQRTASSVKEPLTWANYGKQTKLRG